MNHIFFGEGDLNNEKAVSLHLQIWTLSDEDYYAVSKCCHIAGMNTFNMQRCSGRDHLNMIAVTFGKKLKDILSRATGLSFRMT
jgi:hypothetical protein